MKNIESLDQSLEESQSSKSYKDLLIDFINTIREQSFSAILNAFFQKFYKAIL